MRHAYKSAMHLKNIDFGLSSQFIFCYLRREREEKVDEGLKGTICNFFSKFNQILLGAQTFG